MSVRVETLPATWNSLGLMHRAVLLYLAKHSDWNSKGIGPKEISLGAGVEIGHVNRILAELVEARQLVHKEEGKPRYVAGRAVVKIHEKGWIDSIPLRDALTDLGVIRPDPTETLGLNFAAQIPRPLAIELAKIFPDKGYHDPARISARADFERHRVQDALERSLSRLLTLPGALDLLREAAASAEAEYEAEHAKGKAEEEERKAWEAETGKQTWWSEVKRPRETQAEEDREHAEAALARHAINTEAHLEADPTRWI